MLKLEDTAQTAFSIALQKPLLALKPSFQQSHVSTSRYFVPKKRAF
jgi:hypothetical protein